ncbi:hypothetical protein OF83DRAFT_1072743 [Amylostereum chailletii]|nr:hypothetical protein OF83DRAFT_1072743 [Amylostereum chailletii]
MEGWVRNNVTFLTLHIPFDKVKKERGADISISDLPVVSSPFRALKYYLCVNASVPATASLFSFAHGTGSKMLTKDLFMARCAEIWAEAGLPVVKTGHSFRIGGATDLLLRGTPPSVVAKQGRWESDAFLLYWRRVQSVLPLFMAQAFSSGAMAQVDVVMSQSSEATL